MDIESNREILQFAINGVDAEYATAVTEAEKRRAEKYDRIRSWWLEEQNGTEQDLAFVSNMVSTSPVTEEPVAETPVTRKPRRSRAKTNGAGGRTIPKEVIQRFVQEVMTDPNVEVITQTEVKVRLLREYPDAKVPSVRSAITNELAALKEQGELELAEEGRAGQPNKYRKTRNLF